MQFSVGTFIGVVTKALSRGDAALLLLCDAYHWAQRHLKELHKKYPEYTQGWLRDRIKASFGVDIDIFSRTVTKAGGGVDSESVKLGYAFIQKHGVKACMRAERRLTTKAFQDLVKEIPDKCTKKTFDEAVAKKGGVVIRQSRLSILNAENRRLREKVKKLESENAQLKEKLRAVRGMVA